jgi:hypothetical protein
VLLLYDCCHAVPTTTGVTGRGVKEVLAACGFEGRAPEVGLDSFTHALITELGRASYNSISVGELHGRLIDYLRTWKSSISTNESGEMRFNSAGKPLYERPRRKTPIHCSLSNEPRRRSIILSPLPFEYRSVGLPVLSGTSSTNHPSKKKRYEYSDEDEVEDYGAQDATECTQVILSIRVNTDQFEIDDWLEWIRDVPPEATKVKVEGVYGSLSTLLLLRMPIATWNLLPDDPAYSFVGFVTTENLAPSFQNLDLDESEASYEPRESEDEELRGSEDEELSGSEDDTLESESGTTGTADDITPPVQAAGPLPTTTSQPSKRALWTCVGFRYPYNSSADYDPVLLRGIRDDDGH